MEIPKTLLSTWSEVAKDGNITADDFEKLKQAAAPNKQDSEFDQAEVKFLQSLKSDLDKNGGVKGRIPVDAVKFTDPNASKITVDTAKVPDTLKKVWQHVSSDGKLSTSDYKQLVDAASPNFDDKEITAEEHAFLKTFRDKFASAGVSELEVLKPEVKKAPEVKPQEKEAPVRIVNESPKKDLAVDADTELQKLQQVKNILEMVSDDPDLAKLKTIVEKKLDNTQSVSRFNYNVKAILTNTEKNNQASLATAKNELAQEFKKLPEILKNNEQVKQIYKEAMSVIDTALAAIKPKASVKPVTKQEEVKPQSQQEEGKKDIPASLKKSWDASIADGKFDADDFNALLKAASPNKRNDEFSDEELEFIQTVKSALDESGGEILFDNGEPQSDPYGVPKTLKSTWDKAIADGKLTTDDFEKLLTAAAPSKKNSEFDDEEIQFISKVRAALEENNGIVSFVDTPDAEENRLENSEFGPVPESLSTEWQKLKAKGSISVSDFNSLILAAAPNNKDEELSEAEFQFISNIRRKLDSGNGTLKIAKTEAQQTPVKTQAKTEAQQPVKTQAKPVNPPADPAMTEFGKVPDNLMTAWKEIKANGYVDYGDLDRLVNIAAPSGLDSDLNAEEIGFLQAIKEKVDGTPKGHYTFKAPVQQKAPVLLNWPGYTQQTKAALQNAYSGKTVGSNMPLLPPRVATQVATDFGASSVKEMQSIVGAKPDGKFGPETYFRAKTFIANELNRTNDPQSIAILGRMLQALGNDPEVLKMKAQIESYSQ